MATTRWFTTRGPADAKGVIVGMTAKGRKALAAARPIHAMSIRRHLPAKLTPARRRELLAVCELLHHDEEVSTSR
jgi:DNA-binding MarR family transcriptional regulator